MKETMLLTRDELIAELESMRPAHEAFKMEIKPKLYAVALSKVMKSWLPADSHFASRGWQFTQKGSNRDETSPFYWDLMLEPIDPEACGEAQVGARLFHATDASNVADIQSKGLLVHKGGTTFTKRSYTPPRIHLATTMDFAIQFARSVDGNSLEKKDWRVIEFRVPDGVVFHPDPLLNPGGVWSTESIPADHIEAIHELMVEASGD